VRHHHGFFAAPPADAAKFASAMKAAKRELDAIERKLGLVYDPNAGAIE
jgi:hypothetical protein